MDDDVYETIVGYFNGDEVIFQTVDTVKINKDFSPGLLRNSLAFSQVGENRFCMSSRNAVKGWAGCGRYRMGSARDDGLILWENPSDYTNGNPSNLGFSPGLASSQDGTQVMLHFNQGRYLHTFSVLQNDGVWIMRAVGRQGDGKNASYAVDKQGRIHSLFFPVPIAGGIRLPSYSITDLEDGRQVFRKTIDQHIGSRPQTLALDSKNNAKIILSSLRSNNRQILELVEVSSAIDDVQISRDAIASFSDTKSLQVISRLLHFDDEKKLAFIAKLDEAPFLIFGSHQSWQIKKLETNMAMAVIKEVDDSHLKIYYLQTFPTSQVNVIDYAIVD